MSFIDKIKTSSGDLVYLVRGDNNGKAVWHYLQVENKAKLPLFLQNIKSDHIDVADYGTVLYSGWGENPPEDIINTINNHYG